MTVRNRQSQRGQTFTETVMILGVMTAIIISLTSIVVPGFSGVVSGLVKHMLVYVGTY